MLPTEAAVTAEQWQKGAGMIREARTLAISVVLLAPALSIVGCTTGSSSRSTLSVRQEFVGSTRYAEGSLSYVQVEDREGNIVAKKRLRPEDHYRLTIRVDAGSYRLRSWQEGCPGHGGCEDDPAPPSDRCSHRITLAEDRTSRALVQLRPGHGCTITVTSAQNR